MEDTFPYRARLGDIHLGIAKNLESMRNEGRNLQNRKDLLKHIEKMDELMNELENKFVFKKKKSNK